MPTALSDPLDIDVKSDFVAIPLDADPLKWFMSADHNLIRTWISLLRDHALGAGSTVGSIWVGDGSDGNATFDGAATVLGMAPASNVYTATRDLFLADATIATGVTLNPNGWRVFASGTLTLTGTGKVASNGGDAVGTVGGATPITTSNNGPLRNNETHTGGTGGIVGGSPTSGLTSTRGPRGYSAGSAAGGTAGTTGPTSGGNGANGVGGQGGGGGGSGGIVGTAGGTGAAGGTVSLLSGSEVEDIRVGDNALFGNSRRNPSGNGWTCGSGGGGGDDGRDTGPVFGVGGGGGGGGGYVVVCAKEIAGTGSIEAKGGNGAAAEAGKNGGGGAGGGGGICVVGIVAGSFPTMSAAGGTGGTGGTATTAGTTGGNGGNGGAGITIALRL